MNHHHPNERTYGGHGRHTIPGNPNGSLKHSHDGDIRKVLRRNGIAPTFDTLDIAPDYVGRHREGADWRSVDAIASRVSRGASLVDVITVNARTWFNR